MIFQSGRGRIAATVDLAIAVALLGGLTVATLSTIRLAAAAIQSAAAATAFAISRATAIGFGLALVLAGLVTAVVLTLSASRGSVAADGQIVPGRETPSPDEAPLS